MMKKIVDYLKKQTFWWWFSNILLTIIIVLIIFPGIRSSLITLFISSQLKEPNLQQKNKSIPQGLYTWKVYDVHDDTALELQSITKETVFLNIWATWCGPCVAEMGSIEALYEEMDNDVHFVLVSKESAQKVKTFADENYPDLPLYYTDGFPRDFNITSYPTTVIIHQNKILMHEKGAAQWDSDNVKDFLQGLIDS